MRPPTSTNDPLQTVYSPHKYAGHYLDNSDMKLIWLSGPQNLHLAKIDIFKERETFAYFAVYSIVKQCLDTLHIPLLWNTVPFHILTCTTPTLIPLCL